MKKVFITFLAAGFIVSCGSNSNNAGNSATSDSASTSTNATSSAPADPAVEKGLELVAKSDCLGCHKVDEPLQGPAYTAVAERYKGKGPEIVDSLANKIIHGGSGNWGQVQMTPHPNLSKEDAQTMVKYVLSLKK
jgi:cytochrome c